MASSLTNTGARFNDPLKCLQEEIDLLSKAASTDRSRPSRFNVYLQRLKGEFDIMAVELESFQKEREAYEAIIEAQAKELEDIRRKVICEKCGEGTANARGNLDGLTTSGGVNTTGKATTGHSSPSFKFMHKLLRPFAITPTRPSQPTSYYTKPQPAPRSQSTSLPSPSSPSQASTSIFGAIIFNDEVKKELDVETVHTLSHQRAITCVKFSRDGKYVAAGCLDGKAYIYDIRTGNLTCTLSGANSAVWSLCFSHDGQYLAISHYCDFCVYMWEISSKGLRKTFTGHTSYIWSLDFSPNGRLLASASGDNSVRLWNDQLAKILTDDSKVSEYYRCAVFSRDGIYVAASNSSGMVRIWEVHTGQLVRSVKAHMESVNSVRFTPDGLVSGGHDKILRIWDVRSLLKADSWDSVAEPMQEFSGHEGVVSSFSISPDGRWVASGSADKSVRIWDTRNAAEQCILAHRNCVYEVDFSPAGGYLASTGNDGTLVIWRYSYISPGASCLDGSDPPPL